MAKKTALEYIQEKGWQFKQSGAEIRVISCPYCEPGEKGDYSHFYINSTENIYHCHKCDAGGTLYRLMMDMGDISPVSKAIDRHYVQPVAKPKLTENADNIYKQYETKRGIKADILKKYQVGFENGATVFQYFDEKGVLFNRKYKTKDKEMWTEKGADRNFYGLQFYNFDNETALIVEGEDDCHALAQMGFDNVLSVPFGAGNYTESMHKIMQRIEKAYLFFDMDEKGQQGAKNFAEKAGLYKCKNVLLQYKDVRDCMLHGQGADEISKAADAAVQFRHEEIITIADNREQLIDELMNPKIKGIQLPVGEFNEIVGGIRMGELSVVIGHTGRGKSTFAYNLGMWCESVGLPTMIMAFENKYSSVVRKMIEIYNGENFYENHTSRAWMVQQFDGLCKKNLYFLNKQKYGDSGFYDIERMGKIIEHASKCLDCKIFVIDHLHYFLKQSNPEHMVHNIDMAMRTIKQWTIRFNIHIVLVVHPSKTQAEGRGARKQLAELDVNSAKGSSTISQESDNFWVVKKAETASPQSIVIVQKNRELGKLGKMTFDLKDNLCAYVLDDIYCQKGAWYDQQ